MQQKFPEKGFEKDLKRDFNENLLKIWIELHLKEGAILQTINWLIDQSTINRSPIERINNKVGKSKDAIIVPFLI